MANYKSCCSIVLSFLPQICHKRARNSLHEDGENMAVKKGVLKNVIRKSCNLIIIYNVYYLFVIALLTNDQL